MIKVFIFVLAAMLTFPAYSANPEEAAIRSRLAQLVPQEPDSIQATGIAGLYMVMFGSQVVYMTQDGRYLIQGSVMDLNTRQDLTETAMNSVRLKLLNDYDASKMIVYSPDEGKKKHSITVFTDIDCPYCVKLHREMDEYLAAGIEVRYMLFPRAGIGSESYQTAVNAWCADDKLAALTQAKNRESIPAKTCDNPVAEQYQLGQSMGVTGTPALVMEDGSLVPGYVPAQRLTAILNQPG